MYEIKITVEIPGLPEAINALANALKATPVTAFNPGVTHADAINFEKDKLFDATPAQAESPIAEQPTQATPVATAITPEAAPAKSYTVDDLSRAGATLIDQGKMSQLLDLLKKYGVQAVTQLDASVYPAFVEEMKALGAQL